MTNTPPPSPTHHRDIERFVMKNRPEDTSWLVLECRACGSKAENQWVFEDDPDAAVAEKLALDELNLLPCASEQAT